MPSPWRCRIGFEGPRLCTTGNRVLQACLPPENFERFVRASAFSNTAVTFLDSKLHRLHQIDIPPVDRMAPESERPISRIALRRILLEGLEDVVVFDKTFVAYKPTPDRRSESHDATSRKGRK